MSALQIFKSQYPYIQFTKRFMLFGVAIVVGGSALISCTSDAEKTDTDSSNQESQTDQPGYKYFGSPELAAGSTLEQSVDIIENSDDIELIESPENITVEITTIEEKPVVSIQVSDETTPGTYTISFKIKDEPEPVNWTIKVV